MSTQSEHELAFAGPAALARLVHDRQVSPRELVQLCLRRVEALDPRLNAFRELLAERALAEADALGGERLSGPLAGVPLAVKDDTALAGAVATRGTRALAASGRGVPAAADAEPVRRLRAAGAIPIGITNVPELMIFPWTATAANGITRNPWNPARTPGGSSGGSAAAVAAGLVPVATGSDGGGSIRIPAACCGLVGLKPSRGRVWLGPERPGWLGMSTVGALTRTVADSALLLDVLAGPAAADPDPLPRPARPYVDGAATDPKPLRIAVSRRTPPGVVARIGAEQRVALEHTARVLEDLGHRVTPRDPSYGPAQLQFVEAWTLGVDEELQRIGDRALSERSTREMAAAGHRLAPARRRRRLLRMRPRTAARIIALWDEFDVLLTPALARAPIAAEGAYGRSAVAAVATSSQFSPFTSVWNVTGQPAISVPAGFDRDGLPLAVQLVGRVGAEDVLLSLAGQLERAAPWAQHRPPVS